MSHYFLCSQNNDSKNYGLFQMLTAKQNQKFPSLQIYRFAAERWVEEAREKCKEIFWFLHTRVRERVRGAHHWSSGFSSKYIRTSFNTHRQKSKSHFEAETGSCRRRDTNAFPPPNPESKRVFHAPRGSKSTVRSLI